MWFNQKLKNRRLRREHVLDVKLRSSQVRATRIRMAAVALGVVFAVVFTVYLVWRTGELGLNRLVYENKAFSIRSVEVETDGDISVDYLRRWAGVKSGANLLALDLARVKRDLELVPSIHSASVERILPGTVRIRVTERVPLAQVNVPRRSASGGVEMAAYHLDEAGYVILPLDPRQRSSSASQVPEQYPLITGLSMNEVQAGRRIEVPQVQAALQLILAFDRSSISGFADIHYIDVSNPGILVASTTQGSEITFALDRFDQQLRRWHEVFEMGQRLGRSIATLDLAIPNNIPARWMEASVAPPALQKSNKLSRTRKRNV